MDLKLILDLADSGKPRAALLSALDLWRTQPHPMLADLVDLLEARVPLQPPEPRTNKEFHAAWMAVFQGGDPLLYGWLARALDTKVALRSRYYADGFDTKYAVLLQRIEAIIRIAPDPRVAKALIAFVKRARFSTGYDPRDAAKVYGRVLEAVARIQDARGVEPLVELAEHPTATQSTTREVITRAAQTTAAFLGTLEQHPDLQDHEALTAWLPRPPPDIGPQTDAMVAAIEHAPDALGLRRVLADFLLEAGDPRGEFIALQLDGGPDAHTRIEELRRAHERQWLGPLLARVLHEVTFEGGFLYSAGLSANAAASTAEWTQATLDRRLSTLRVLTTGRGNRKHCAAFASSPVLQHLRELHAPAKAVLAAVLAMHIPPPLEVLRLEFRLDSSESTSILETFDRLRILGLHSKPMELDRAWKVLAAAGVFDQVDRVDISGCELDAVLERFEGSGLRALGWMSRTGSIALEHTEGGVALRYATRGWVPGAATWAARSTHAILDLPAGLPQSEVDQILTEFNRRLPELPLTVSRWCVGGSP